MIKAKIIGGNKLLKRFQHLGKDAEVIFKEVVDETAIYVYAQAVNHINKNVQYGTGHLIKSMWKDLSGDQTAWVGNSAEYAGYVEFGTGRKVRVPPEFADIAAKIRSRKGKKFKEGLQAIKDWCKRLGIEESAAYPIFISILRTGVRPRPFMYPAYRMGQRFIKKEAEKQIKKLTKK